VTTSAADDISNIKLDSTRGFKALVAIRWAVGTRFVVACLALVLAVVAGVRYARSLPVRRIEFRDDREPLESTDGDAPPGWVSLLVGSGAMVALLAVVVNAVGLIYALEVHQSSGFGIVGG